MFIIFPRLRKSRRNLLLNLSVAGRGMSYDPGGLRTALAAAVGDDPALVDELRAAFLEGAHTHARALARARGKEEWRVAAWRLQGLAASFGAVALTAHAEAAAKGPVGDPTALRAIGRAIGAFDA